MNVIYVAVICVGAAFICACLKKTWPELALGIALAAGVAVLVALVPQITSLVNELRAISDGAEIDGDYLKAMIQACGISIIGQFAAQICKDAGETALSGRIQLCCRLAMVALAAPIVTDILSRLSYLLSLS